MDKKVVVENTLQSHIDFLEQCGYDVHKLYKNENVGNIESFNYDAIVVSSMKNVPMGATSRPSAPIIEAEGKTPEEVFNILRARY